MDQYYLTQAPLEVAGSKARKVEEFAQEIRQYAEIAELTDEILHKLIQNRSRPHGRNR